MSSEVRSRTFHLFLGFHSFLIGLFPFFLPVYLLKNGCTLGEISLFIGLTGASFCLSLTLWDRWLRPAPFFRTLVISFASELFLLGLLTFTPEIELLPLLALVNGLYTCLFWMVQRTLFFATSHSTNTGRKFGNFQIYVTIILKTGIFIGGLLLEQFGLIAVLGLSGLVSLFALAMLLRCKAEGIPESLKQAKPLKLRSVITFRDSLGSRSTFAIDGVFLYLESYFWLISLFLLVKQNFWQLGMLVILLAVAFTILFYLLKNRIDRLPQQRVYVIGIALYMASWGMRSIVGEGLEVTSLYLLLILITFCTTFFRLVYNKRFFDNARTEGEYEYILQKSYISQTSIALCFGVTFLVASQHLALSHLSLIYLVAAAASPLFFLYKKR